MHASSYLAASKASKSASVSSLVTAHIPFRTDTPDADLKTIANFAQLEYKLGDPERGKTVFEGIVDSHPKRWDLWSIYIDMEASQVNIASLRYVTPPLTGRSLTDCVPRNIFDRVLALKMTSHKAKSFFKKWLDLERRIGDEEGADAVKAKAVEWTQRAAGSS